MPQLSLSGDAADAANVISQTCATAAAAPPSPVPADKLPTWWL